MTDELDYGHGDGEEGGKWGMSVADMLRRTQAYQEKRAEVATGVKDLAEAERRHRQKDQEHRLQVAVQEAMLTGTGIARIDGPPYGQSVVDMINARRLEMEMMSVNPAVVIDPSKVDLEGLKAGWEPLEAVPPYKIADKPVTLDDRWSFHKSSYGGYEVRTADLKTWFRISDKLLAEAITAFLRGEDEEAAKLRQELRERPEVKAP